MRVASTLFVLGLLGCTKAGSTSEPIGNPPPGAKMPPAPPAITIQMSSVTLAEDCGAAAVHPPAPDSTGQSERKRAPRAESEADSDERAKSQRRCEQTSMQLSLTGAPSGSPVQLGVKKVGLFDDKGTLIGELTSRDPSVWSATGAYVPWDQTVAPTKTLAVTYMLSAPNWSKVGNRWDRSYTLKAVLTVGGADRSVEREVRIESPAQLPADVET